MDEHNNVMQGSTAEVNYITTVLTKIIEGFDALESTPDSESLGLWRRQCVWGLGLLGALKARRIKELTEDIEDESVEGVKKPLNMTEELLKRALKDPLLKEIDKLLAQWEPDKDGNVKLTSFENTKIQESGSEDLGTAKYQLNFDSYQHSCFAKDLAISGALMEKEKYNRICDRLSNWFGRAWKVIMQAGIIKLDQQIVSPMVAEGYGDENIRRQVQARKLTHGRN